MRKLLCLTALLWFFSCARFNAQSWLPEYLFLTSTLSASVQTGTLASSGNGIVTATISEVDPAKSFLIFQTRSNLARTVVSEIRGRIASATSLEFERVTDEGSTVPIRWYVVSYAAGVSVQRGSTVFDVAPKNVPITAVSSLSQAFVLHSKTPGAADNTWDSNDPYTAELTTVNNLQFRSNSAASHTNWWEVVEFTNPSMISVQKGSSSLTGVGLTNSSALTSSVDLTRSFLLASFTTSGDATIDVGSDVVRARFGSTASADFDRDVSGVPDDITEILFQAVQLNDGSTVQSGNVHFNTGESQKSVPINDVDVGRAAAFGSVQSGGGQNMGKTPYSPGAGDNDFLGIATATFALSATSVTVERDCTLDAADITYYVVRFGR